MGRLTVSGPTAVTSRTGNNYVMNIVDDFSSFCWSIPLKSKGDTFPQLQLWEWAREMEIDSRTKYTEQITVNFKAMKWLTG
jgi:hypothetical protein